MQYIWGSLSPDSKKIKKRQTSQSGQRKIPLLLCWLVVYFQLMAVVLYFLQSHHLKSLDSSWVKYEKLGLIQF